MKLDHPFIRLPFRFDAERLAAEVAAFDPADWMVHPDRAGGNYALPLIAAGGGRNNDFRGEMLPTPFLARSEYLQQVIASFGEVFGRSRLMRLEAGHEVSPHMDYNYHWHTHVRIHVPVITHPAVAFTCGDHTVHMGAGECWIFDAWRVHRVVNGGPAARVHLVIDTAGSSRFWETVDRAAAAAAAGQPLEPAFIPWVPGRQVAIETERFNLLPVMPPGEVDALVQDLLADVAAETVNDRAEVERLRRFLFGFCRDWRAAWYRHGLGATGWRAYGEIIEAVSRALPEPAVPLVVAGDCPANLVLRTKILGVALLPDMARALPGAAVPAGGLPLPPVRGTARAPAAPGGAAAPQSRAPGATR